MDAHGFDEFDMIELIMNCQWANDAARIAAYSYAEGDHPWRNGQACKDAGEAIRDDVVSAEALIRGITSRELNLTEMIFSRLLGSVDWTAVGRHYLKDVAEAAS